MSPKSFVRMFVCLFATLALSTPVLAKNTCSGAKTKAECGKKTTCHWSKTACVAKAAAKSAAKTTGKPAAKATAAKPAGKHKADTKSTTKSSAKPAGKAAAKKPAPAPAPAADPADMDVNEEALDSEDMGGEEEDF